MPKRSHEEGQPTLSTVRLDRDQIDRTRRRTLRRLTVRLRAAARAANDARTLARLDRIVAAGDLHKLQGILTWAANRRYPGFCFTDRARFAATVGRENEYRAEATEPTEAQPGTDEKIRVLAARYATGQTLFDPADRAARDEAVV